MFTEFRKCTKTAHKTSAWVDEKQNEKNNACAYEKKLTELIIRYLTGTLVIPDPAVCTAESNKCI